MAYPLIFIVGPTAVGKSDLAMAASLEFGGLIANCDSIQCYRDLEIGAAKPSHIDREKVPHLLFDWVEAPHTLTAAEFRRQALKEITEPLSRVPVFGVGGSGFYIQALEKGMYPVAKVPDEVVANLELRREKMGLATLFAELRDLDPDYAQKIKPEDSYRIVRALALMQSEKRRVSDIQAEFSQRVQGTPFKVKKIGLQLPRDVLREKIQLRTEAMLKRGLQEEVKTLVDRGLKDWVPLKSVGYKETLAVVLGQKSAHGLEEEINLSTMRLAKKQMTWFRRDRDIHWVDPRQGWEKSRAVIKSLLSASS